MASNSSFDSGWAARFEDMISGAAEPAEVAATPMGGVPLLPADVPDILTTGEMARADQAAIRDGTPGSQLMEQAGRAVAEAVMRLRPEACRVAVMTGPGNNGGDGFVAARILAEAGYRTTVWMASARDSLKGDAGFAAAAWTGSAKGLSAAVTEDADIVVDALFGAGLSKPLDDQVARAVDAVNAADVPVVAVDLPSGIQGDTGAVLRTAIHATETVTFFRRKPGHVLSPGRFHCGHLSIADIGIAPSVLAEVQPRTRVNGPHGWSLPPLGAGSHKYDRGHTLVLSGGPLNTGAARLAAQGALRVGSGLVSVAASPNAAFAHATHLTAIMLREIAGTDDFAAILDDARFKAVVLGPGLGLGENTAGWIEAALASRTALVLDADALTVIGQRRDDLLVGIGTRDAPTILTPHAGEFERVFGGLADDPSKIVRAQRAADMTGAVVVFKGPDTVVAGPEGAIVNVNAPPQLATAGSGDVLAGMIAGLVAQGMDAQGAAAAAVWLHGQAGRCMGRGLIAEDIPQALPQVFADLEEGNSQELFSL